MVRAVGARAGLHLAALRAEAAHDGVLERRRIEGRHEAVAPGVVLLRAQFHHQVGVLALALVAVRGVHILVVGGVETVLDGTLVVVVHIEGDERRAPLIRAVLGHGHDRRALLLGQVAEEREHDAVLLLHRVGVDAGARRRLGLAADGRDAGADAFAVVAPAVVGALDGAVVLALAGSERGAAVDAGVGEHGGLALVVAEHDEVVREDADLLRGGAEVDGTHHGVPEVHEHSDDLPATWPQFCTLNKQLRHSGTGRPSADRTARPSRPCAAVRTRRINGHPPPPPGL